MQYVPQQDVHDNDLRNCRGIYHIQAAFQERPHAAGIRADL